MPSDGQGSAPADQLNYDTFEWELERAIERQQFHEYLQPINHQGGVQTADGLAELLPFASVKDYQDWLKRMAAVPTLVDQTIALMREGVEVRQRAAQGADAARSGADRGADRRRTRRKSPFYRPVPAISAMRSRQRPAPALQAAGAAGRCATAWCRAYRKLADVRQRRIPAQDPRLDRGCGPARTARPTTTSCARYYTTTDLTAAQIHAIGLKEVARIRGEMEKVKDADRVQGLDARSSSPTCAPIRSSSRRRPRRC